MNKEPDRMVKAPRQTAFIFPGQASQAVGMGKDLHESSPAARAVFEEIDDVLGRSLTTLMFEGPMDDLTRTDNAQPAVAAVSIAAWKAMEEATGQSQVPQMAAGHSLGEYSALAVTGALSTADTIRLIVERGRVMQSACHKRPGGMAALIGIDEITAEEVCRETGTYVSNINTSEQIIISGEHMRLARALDLAAARGAKKAIPLAVGGAFHSGLMEPAQHGLNDVIDSMTFFDPIVPLIGNVDARPLRTARDVKEELKLQLMSCVRWNHSIDFMTEQGVDRFIEIGPGRVLAGMVKRICRDADIVNIGDYKSVQDYAATAVAA